MSRPANLYDNAFCESFMRTLKREEIDARAYRDRDDLRAHVAEFIEPYYNRSRLHSALGYRPPEEFEQMATAAEHNLAGGYGAASMSFSRHGESYRWMGRRLKPPPRLIQSMSLQPAIPSIPATKTCRRGPGLGG